MEMSFKSLKKPTSAGKPKGSKDLQSEKGLPSWSMGSRFFESPEVKSNEFLTDNSVQSRSFGSKSLPSAAVKTKTFKELHLPPVAMKGPIVTKRRSATTAQPRMQQPTLEGKSSKEVDRIAKVPRKSSTKPPSQIRITAKSENGDPHGRPKSTGSEEERERVFAVKKSLQQALIKADSLVNQLEKLEDDIELLEVEKTALLDELLVCEGLAVNPYPRFRRRNFLRVQQGTTTV